MTYMFGFLLFERKVDGRALMHWDGVFGVSIFWSIGWLVIDIIHEVVVHLSECMPPTPARIWESPLTGITGVKILQPWYIIHNLIHHITKPRFPQEIPPLTSITLPFIYELSLLIKNTTASATSSGSPNLPIDILA